MLRDDPDCGARRAPGLRRRLYITEGEPVRPCVCCGGAHHPADPCPVESIIPGLPLAPVHAVECEGCGFHHLPHHDCPRVLVLEAGITGDEAKAMGYEWRRKLDRRNWKALGPKGQKARKA